MIGGNEQPWRAGGKFARQNNSAPIAARWFPHRRFGWNGVAHAMALIKAPAPATAPKTPPCILIIFNAARWLP